MTYMALLKYPCAARFSLLEYWVNFIYVGYRRNIYCIQFHVFLINYNAFAFICASQII